MTDYTPEELEAQEIIPQGWAGPEVTHLKQERDELLDALKNIARWARIFAKMAGNLENKGFSFPDEYEDAMKLIAKVEK